jgi:hypothetical protein
VQRSVQYWPGGAPVSLVSPVVAALVLAPDPLEPVAVEPPPLLAVLEPAEPVPPPLLAVALALVGPVRVALELTPTVSVAPPCVPPSSPQPPVSTSASASATPTWRAAPPELRRRERSALAPFGVGRLDGVWTDAARMPRACLIAAAAPMAPG